MAHNGVAGRPSCLSLRSIITDPGRHLSQVSPGVTLALALIAIFLIQGIDTQPLATWTLIISAVLFTVLARGLPRRLGYLTAFITFIFIFLGNYIPQSLRTGDWHHLSTVSSAAIPACMRTAQIFAGLIWLATTRLSALTNFVSIACSRLRLPNYFTALILSGFGVAPKLLAEYRVVRAALLVRSQIEGTLWAKLKREWRMRRRALFAIVARIFDDAASLAFSVAVTTENSPAGKISAIVACKGDHRQKIMREGIYKFIGPCREDTIQFARSISGFIPYFRPDLTGSAQLIIDGQSTQDQPECDWLASHISFVSDDIWESLPYPTAADHIKIIGVSNEQIAGWSTFFDVGHLISRDVSTLSGGEKIRLALSLALAHEKSVIVLLHVLAQLDQSIRARFQEWLRQSPQQRMPRCNSAVIACETQSDLLPNDLGIAIFAEPTDSSAQMENHLAADLTLPGVNAPVRLSVRNLRVVRAEHVIIPDLSFDIRAGEIVALTGPNGSGKTTVALAISGVLSLAGGKVEYSKIGIAFQEGKWQLSGPTCRDEIELGFLEQPDLLASEIVQQECAWCGVEPEGLTLSLGENGTRLMSVASMVQHAQMLVLDEPTADLDPYVRVQLTSRVTALVKAGFGVLLISHDPWVLKLAHRGIKLG
jgi:energy-coupling factor transport system ATP-binding protein